MSCVETQWDGMGWDADGTGGDGTGWDMMAQGSARGDKTGRDGTGNIDGWTDGWMDAPRQDRIGRNVRTMTRWDGTG